MEQVVGPLAGVMEGIDQRALVVRLDVTQLRASLGGDGGELGDDVVERVGAVDLGLARAEEVQVRSVEHEDLRCHA